MNIKKNMILMILRNKWEGGKWRMTSIFKNTYVIIAKRTYLNYNKFRLRRSDYHFHHRWRHGSHTASEYCSLRYRLWIQLCWYGNRYQARSKYLAPRIGPVPLARTTYTERTKKVKNWYHAQEWKMKIQWYDHSSNIIDR